MSWVWPLPAAEGAVTQNRPTVQVARMDNVVNLARDLALDIDQLRFVHLTCYIPAFSRLDHSMLPTCPIHAVTHVVERFVTPPFTWPIWEVNDTMFRVKLSSIRGNVALPDQMCGGPHSHPAALGPSGAFGHAALSTFGLYK